VELTVLGCSGSYGGPLSNACSGYLIRSGDTTICVDCGNGTLGHLQQHADIEQLTAVVLTHEHPDHCVDLYGLHVLVRYGIERKPVPVLAPVGLEAHLGALVGGDWGDAFEWNVISDGDHAELGSLSVSFSRTDHPPPTYGVEIAGDGSRLVYTSDTGPGWTVGAFAPGADLVLSEATYLEDDKASPLHISAHEAGVAAREAGARRLMLTHLWPQNDQRRAVEEGSEAFGEPVMLATPHLVTQV
jgi:ribonuclease BN (tRNA processing enzyme)